MGLKMKLSLLQQYLGPSKRHIADRGKSDKMEKLVPLQEGQAWVPVSVIIYVRFLFVLNKFFMRWTLSKVYFSTLNFWSLKLSAKKSKLSAKWKEIPNFSD